MATNSTFLRGSTVFVVLSLLSASPSPFGAGALEAQRIPVEERTFNEQVLRPSGQPIIPLFDGWFQNDDGSYDICFGYYSLNTEEVVDIPLGPDNFIEPSRFDGVQPTHFEPAPETPYRRRYCVFTVTVPEDFGRQRVVWTLRSNGETASNPGHLMQAYVLDEPDSDGRGESAPTLRLEEGGAAFRGRGGRTVGPRRVAAGEPMELEAWVEHEGDRVWLGWAKHRGPGEVSIRDPEIWVDGGIGTAVTMAVFEVPGRYLLRVQAIDDPVEDFEFHCCWTNGYVQVIVTP